MPTLTQLEYILAVYHTRNFGLAAKKCHISQPTLSVQIQKAEEQLNAIIFDRSKKPILVTEKGQKIVDQAKIILNEHSKLYETLNKGNKISGNFNLGVIPTLSPYLLPLFIEKFSKTYPSVQLNISEHKTKDLVKALHEDLIDAGLAVTPLEDEKLIEDKLFNEPLFVYASKKHPLMEKNQVTQSDLEPNSVWLLEEGHCFRNQVIELCSLKSTEHVIKKINFTSGNLETLINIIKNGEGYTLLPYLTTFYLKPEEKKNHLRSFIKPVPLREVSLVYVRNFYKKEIIEALRKIIKQSLPKDLLTYIL